MSCGHLETKLALDCFALDFDYAAKIIVWALTRLFV
jgi:hypothetical protein